MSVMTTLILVAAGLVGATGLILGLFLGVASEKFKVEVDEREAEVRAALPGSNCGACGFPGCDGCAKAISKGQAPVNQCPVGGAPVAEKIAAIMGTDSVSMDNVKKVAHVHCQGDCDKAKQQAHYSGIADCNDLVVVPGGTEKACPYSCCGYGSCVKACPKSLIALVPYKKKHIVSCKNLLKGKQVKDACSIGCIACGICEKNCPFDAIHVLDDLAVMNEKCTDCGICAQKCPTSAITGKRVKKPEVKTAAQPSEVKTAAQPSEVKTAAQPAEV